MQHLAGIYMALSLLVSVILRDVMTLLPPVVLGALTGWLYLRFLQVKGDAAYTCAAACSLRLASALQFMLSACVRVRGKYNARFHCVQGWGSRTNAILATCVVNGLLSGSSGAFGRV